MKAKQKKWWRWGGGVAVLAGLGWWMGWGYGGGEADMAAEGSAAVRAVAVVLTPARAMTFESRVEVMGSVEAKEYAVVAARVPGVLDAVCVEEGDVVEAGRTRLFQSDSLNLRKAEEVARQGLSVAESSLLERRANLNQVRATFELSEKDVARFRRLRDRGVVAAREWEEQEVRFQQATAQVAHAEALVALAEAQRQQARLQWEMAGKNLEDSQVLAPLSGRVSRRFMEPGEYPDVGTPVVRIERMAPVEVTAFLPEEYYDQVRVGETEVQVRTGQTDLGNLVVSSKSPTVSFDLRTFEIKALMEEPPEGVVPGRLIHVTVVLARREGVGVPRQAVEARAGGWVVFAVEAEKARAMPVELGWEEEGWVEVTGASVAAGVPVVTMGQQFLESGREVRVREEGR